MLLLPRLRDSVESPPWQRRTRSAVEEGEARGIVSQYELQYRVRNALNKPRESAQRSYSCECVLRLSMTSRYVRRAEKQSFSHAKPAARSTK
ncbi:hypothetical protein CFAM422_000630 [Trichoderma lentiforme]|uniref:Uncharacterized protein n=1 Tax=Trichoderma lentiforme TaxID=1567552 RepID=A0A9P4XS90_9HYPO|nr:hypothetical protein CFAM422_000630 [Trichoderma lentiforme]